MITVISPIHSVALIRFRRTSSRHATWRRSPRTAVATNRRTLAGGRRSRAADEAVAAAVASPAGRFDGASMRWFGDDNNDNDDNDDDSGRGSCARPAATDAPDGSECAGDGDVDGISAGNAVDSRPSSTSGRRSFCNRIAGSDWV